MIGCRYLRLVLVVAMASAHAASAMADSSEFVQPKMLNEPIINRSQTNLVNFQMAQTWGKLSKGTRLVGTYDAEFVVCITRVIFTGARPEYAEPGRCLAKAVPAPEVIERAANGVIPQAQPFLLYDLPAEWHGRGIRR